ncbi:hypothetical protein N665_0007s0019 [Sinapis alba]|nr:hypothetical protein N665_0007s0019 [Sinapis alba]
MKMLKEHAEAMEDLDELFYFLWGRLAFDMVMGSIKQRDEVSLSKNTIAVKGFALALQLVMVEAVQSFTEVVLETCSSSESDSKDEDDDFVRKKYQKTDIESWTCSRTGKKNRESTLVWTDEVNDVNMHLIPKNYPFSRTMFKGGASKLDVEIMQENTKNQAKQKKKTKPQTNNEMTEDKRIKYIVLNILKQEVQRLDVNVAKAVASAGGASENFASYNAKVVESVESILKDFKEDVLRSVCAMSKYEKVQKQTGRSNADEPHNVKGSMHQSPA